MAFCSGRPLICDEPAATNRLALGDKVRFIPGHCDLMADLYDWYVCVRGNRVERV